MCGAMTEDGRGHDPGGLQRRLCETLSAERASATVPAYRSQRSRSPASASRCSSGGADFVSERWHSSCVAGDTPADEDLVWLNRGGTTSSSSVEPSAADTCSRGAGRLLAATRASVTPKSAGSDGGWMQAPASGARNIRLLPPLEVLEEATRACAREVAPESHGPPVGRDMSRGISHGRKPGLAPSAQRPAARMTHSATREAGVESTSAHQRRRQRFSFLSLYWAAGAWLRAKSAEELDRTIGT